ncbi:hypothetical protein ACIQXW_02615 [Lysinibacillus sp. NPDC097162]|uniref:hypothetical protein n=1 Tax=Lysinibacillus sp. NPDC097162 TaxID=3364140 RepID=UPI00381299D1
MYITSNHGATVAKYAQSILSNPKLQLSEQQKSDVEAIVKKHDPQKSETYTKAASLSSLTANPYNPFYGVNEPANPYNYSAEGMFKANSTSKFHQFNNLAKLNEQVDVRQSAAMHKFELLRSQL